MNKKIMAILLCVLFAATVTIPVATAINQAPQEEIECEQTAGVLSRTRVTGIIIGKKTTGLSTTFTVVFGVYKTNHILAEDEGGVLLLKRVSFIGKFTGYMGENFVCGSFRGTI